MGILELVLIIVLILLLVGAVPAWNVRGSYGGGPVSLVGLLLVIILVVLLVRLL